MDARVQRVEPRAVSFIALKAALAILSKNSSHHCRMHSTKDGRDGRLPQIGMYSDDQQTLASKQHYAAKEPVKTACDAGALIRNCCSTKNTRQHSKLDRNDCSDKPKNYRKY